jgi:hypothetical protein
MGLLNHATELLSMALRMERETVIEIDTLGSMGIYPSAELAIIRKDNKALKEAISTELAQQEGEPLQNIDVEKIELAYEGELSVAEKKLAILRGRRLDEEDSRNLKKKKMARAKQLEESQSRDPLNFKNQSRY